MIHILGQWSKLYIQMQTHLCLYARYRCHRLTPPPPMHTHLLTHPPHRERSQEREKERERKKERQIKQASREREQHRKTNKQTSRQTNNKEGMSISKYDTMRAQQNKITGHRNMRRLVSLCC